MSMTTFTADFDGVFNYLSNLAAASSGMRIVADLSKKGLGTTFLTGRSPFLVLRAITDSVESFEVLPEVYGEMGAVHCFCNNHEEPDTRARELLELTYGSTDPRGYHVEFLATEFDWNLKAAIMQIVIETLNKDDDIVNDARLKGYGDAVTESYIEDFVFADEYANCKGVLTTSMLPSSEIKKKALEILSRHGRTLVAKINAFLQENKIDCEAFLGSDCIEILSTKINKSTTVKERIIGKNIDDNLFICIGDSPKLKGDVRMAFAARECGVKDVVFFCSGDWRAFFNECGDQLRGSGIITVTAGKKFDELRCDPLDKSTYISIEMMSRLNDAIKDINTPWCDIEAKLNGFTITHWL